MKKFMIEFEEVIKNNHQLIIKVGDHVSEDELDHVLDQLQSSCHSFSDVIAELQSRGATIVDSLEDESMGSIEFDYLVQTDRTECL